IFTALAEHYPQTVKYFQQIPNGEADLTRVYWWEQRWREGVKHPQDPRQVIFQTAEPIGQSEKSGQTGDQVDPGDRYDLIYIGGALGLIHATRMAQLGHRVLLVERLAFGRMNREWNISRAEFQTLIDLNLFTPEEFEAVIAAEYEDGFHKFFDHNNPPQAKAPVLHTPTVLNIAIDAERFLQRCGEKFLAAGGQVWDYTEFQSATIAPDGVTVKLTHLPSQTSRVAQGRLLIDAMGTASPIAWQLNQGKPFDSVCPTVGAVFSGLDPAVWDLRYGDVLNSHGDISRGRQLIWELFPAEGEDVTVYLFHYHQVHPDNPGSLLEMYEDFFSILPEYRRCDLEQLQWKKATFGYIPGYFSKGSTDRPIAFDRVLAI
ncbi:MAG: NAD(P)/FAD-dependent oxidoreductase, partial [Prochlorotrichaceae cyanobacterium]